MAIGCSELLNVSGEDARADVLDSLAVIVPLYNEATTVTELLSRLVLQPSVSEVIVVDDGSTDDSVVRVRDWLAVFQRSCVVNVSLILHEKNRGKGRAIRTGLEHVTRSHVVIQDADLEYDPADINKLWGLMQSGQVDVVYGSRYLHNSAIQKGRFVMQFGVRLLNLVVRVLYGVRLTDEACCYKMFRTADLRAMHLQCDRFEFCAEVTARSLMSELRLQETNVSYESRRIGKKISWRDGWPALATLVGIRLSRKRFVTGSNCRGPNPECAQE
ncbi:MAG: glycosyltransferase family 2 protein [Planctomycetaceae bacterium]